MPNVGHFMQAAKKLRGKRSKLQSERPGLMARTNDVQAIGRRHTARYSSAGTGPFDNADLVAVTCSNPFVSANCHRLLEIERNNGMTELSLRGVFAPTLTPVSADLSIDLPAYIEFCNRLLEGGCHGLVLFGTNSEATSFSAGERMAAVDAVIEAGIPASRLVVGTGAASIVEAADLTRHAVQAGCRGVLTLPPYYYPGVSEEGLFRSFAAVLDRVDDERLRMYFYHIPQVSGIPLSPSLLTRLAEAYPGQAAGVKDSSGDVNTLLGLHEVARNFPGFAVFCGTEGLLLKNMQGGGGGCISGMANVLPHVIRDLYDNWKAADAEDRQNRTNWVRDAILESGFNMIASLKVIVADQTGRQGWSRVRPPLVDLTEAEQEQLLARLSRPVPA